MKNKKFITNSLYVGVTEEGNIELFQCRSQQATSISEMRTFQSSFIDRTNACSFLLNPHDSRYWEYFKKIENDRVAGIIKDRKVYISVPLVEESDYTPKVAIEEFSDLEHNKGNFVEIGEKRTIITNASLILDCINTISEKPKEKINEYEVNCKIEKLYSLVDDLGIKDFTVTEDDCLKAIKLVKENQKKDEGPILSKKISS